MKQFFGFRIENFYNGYESIWFSKIDGSHTDVVILDDGWSPNITKYVRDGEKTWGDVVEELDCMTNVETRDEALDFIEKLNAIIHRAKKDIEEKQSYTVMIAFISQFSNRESSIASIITGPPDDGNVIIISTDILTAPPGQINFKLRFKRIGVWIENFNNPTTVSSSLTAPFSPPSGFWELQTTLPTNITIPTPISLALSFTAGDDYFVRVENLFLCVNVENVSIIDAIFWGNSFPAEIVTYETWRLALYRQGFRFQGNTDSYPLSEIPFAIKEFTVGTYAIFVAWRSVQPNVSHRLQLTFENNVETRNTLLLANDTQPHYQYLGTVTMTVPTIKLYLKTTIGHSTGFEIEKIIFVRLKNTSTIIRLSDWIFMKNAALHVQNSLLNPFKKVATIFTSGGYEFNIVTSTYDSIDIVADNQSLNIVAIGNSPDVFSLRTDVNYYTVTSLPVTITYHPIRTTFH